MVQLGVPPVIWHRTLALVQVWTPPLPTTQFFASVLMEAALNDPSPHGRTSTGLFQTDPALDTTATWGVNQQIKTSLFFFFSLSGTLSLKEIK